MLILGNCYDGGRFLKGFYPRSRTVYILIFPLYWGFEKAFENNNGAEEHRRLTQEEEKDISH